jgi:hypothetical protein
MVAFKSDDVGLHCGLTAAGASQWPAGVAAINVIAEAPGHQLLIWGGGRH